MDIIAAMDIIEFVFQFTNIHISVPLIPGRRPVALEPMQTFSFSRYFQKGSNRLHSLAVALHCCQCWCQPFHFCTLMGFPGGASGTEPVCQCRRLKRHRINPWVRKIPWRRKWEPAPVFLPEESHGERSLAGYSPWGREELDMTEVT